MKRTAGSAVKGCTAGLGTGGAGGGVGGAFFRTAFIGIFFPDRIRASFSTRSFSATMSGLTFRKLVDHARRGLHVDAGVLEELDQSVAGDLIGFRERGDSFLSICGHTFTFTPGSAPWDFHCFDGRRPIGYDAISGCEAHPHRGPGAAKCDHSPSGFFLLKRDSNSENLLGAATATGVTVSPPPGTLTPSRGLKRASFSSCCILPNSVCP